MRDLTAGMQTEFEKTVKSPIIFFEGQFTSGYVRLFSGIGTLTWNGKTWLGAGSLGTITPVQETLETKAVGMRATFSGIPAANRALILSEARRGQEGNVWLGMLDANMNVIANPYNSFRGRLDQPEIDKQSGETIISVNYENRMIDFERPRERRYTPEDQKTRYPDDKGLDYVPNVQNWSEKWGQK